MKIVLVDDRSLVRHGIAALLQARGHHVVGQAGDGRTALQVIGVTQPDIVLTELRIPRMNAFQVARTLTARDPEIRIAILTDSTNEQDLIEAVASGAVGYLLKSTEPSDLFVDLARLFDGEAVLPPSMAHAIWEQFDRTVDSAPGADDSVLTEREWDVIEQLTQGRRNREIAEILEISENTVKYHIRRILEKLQLRNRTEVTAWAGGQERARTS